MGKLTIGEMVAVKKSQMSLKQRGVDGLAAVLRKVADDIEKGRAVEAEFDLKVDQSLEMFDYMTIHLETYHVRQPKKDKKELKDGKK